MYSCEMVHSIKLLSQIAHCSPLFILSIFFLTVRVVPPGRLHV